jgi:hypothetical protein
MALCDLDGDNFVNDFPSSFNAWNFRIHQRVVWP